jgi:hypothetical protein
VEEAKDQSGINTDLPVDLVPFDKLVKQIGRKVGMAGTLDVLVAPTARQCADSESFEHCRDSACLGYQLAWTVAALNGPSGAHGRQGLLKRATV